MQKNARLGLLALLLIPCWVVAVRFDVDLVNLHFVADVAHRDLTRVYATNGNLGRYFYGPVSVVLAYPMGWFSYVVVKYFWIVVQTIAFVIFWRYLAKLYPWLEDKRRFWAWFAIFIVAINPIHNNFQSNNIQLMLAAVLVMAEWFTIAGSERAQRLAGAAVAIAAAIKVFPGFVAAYYIFTKPKAVKLGVVAGTAISLIAPYVAFGLTGGNTLYRGFFSNLTTYNVENSLTRVMDILCLPSLLERWFTVDGVLPSGVQTAIRVFILVISAVFFVLAWRGTRAATPTRQIDWWAMAMALSVMLNPSTRPHYFIFYIPAYCSVFGAVFDGRGRAYFVPLLLVSVALLAFTVDAIVGKPLNDFLEFQSIPTYGMLIVCGLLAVGVLGSRVSSAKS